MKGAKCNYLKMDISNKENMDKLIFDGFQVLGHPVLVIRALDEVLIIGLL